MCKIHKNVTQSKIIESPATHGLLNSHPVDVYWLPPGKGLLNPCPSRAIESHPVEGYWNHTKSMVIEFTKSSVTESHQSQILNILLVKGYSNPIYCQPRVIKPAPSQGLLNPYSVRTYWISTQSRVIESHPVEAYWIPPSYVLLKPHPIKGYWIYPVNILLLGWYQVNKSRNLSKHICILYTNLPPQYLPHYVYQLPSS